MTLLDSGTLFVEIRRRRTWRERLFSLPWRPWRMWTMELQSLGPIAGGITFTQTLPEAPTR